MHDEKLSETIAIKIKPSQKAEFDHIPEHIKKKLLRKIRKDIDFAVYVSKYRPPDDL